MSHCEIAARPGLIPRPPGLFPVLSTQVPPEQSCPCGELCLPSSRTSPQEERCLGRGSPCFHCSLLPSTPPNPGRPPTPAQSFFSLESFPDYSHPKPLFCHPPLLLFSDPQYLQVLRVNATTLNLSSTSQSDHCPPHSFI